MAGLLLVVVITFGKNAAYAEGAHFKPASESQKSSGGALVALATMGVGVAGFQRRKG